MMQSTPFDQNYFSTNTYEKVSFKKYSQYWFSNRFYAILARRNGKTGGRLLETGCGLGHLVGQLERSFETYGMDINPWALAQAKETAPRSVLFTGSAQEMPFPDGYFDVIISKHVVEHLPEPEKAIIECGRLLGPGGVLLLATPNLDSVLKPLKGKKWIGYQDPTHISLRKPDEWREMITSAGMQVNLAFSDGCWDVPYIPVIPAIAQKFIFGSLGGLQAVTGVVFNPSTWGESIIFIAKKAA